MTTESKVLLVIDIQQEYVTDGRPFHISAIEPSLTNARNVLEGAREAGVPVWHVQHQQEKDVFVKGSGHVDFVPGFEPKAGEPVYVKNMYSAFSSPGLVQSLARTKPHEIVLIGYGSSMCCLATIIEGVHHGYRFTLVEDATAAKSTDRVGEIEMHQSAVQVIQQFAELKRTKDVLFDVLDSERAVALSGGD